MAELGVSKMAHALAAHAATRQSHVARNIANADTPGYVATDIAPFAETLEEGHGLRATRPGHLGYAEAQTGAHVIERPSEPAPNGNTVSLEDEMMHAAVIRQQHDMALSVYDTTRRIMSAALGRPR